jgi:hypothetical protein
MRTTRGVAIFTIALALLASVAHAQVFIRITTPPPPLPVYVQPVVPGPDFIWVPGYWAWGEFGYFWVPGTWVRAAGPGLLWTPGYWAWNEGVYVWRAGYWGPRVGFYGGVNYGFGYTGIGYQGGYWRDRVFIYNTAVTRIDSVQITNVYSKTVVTSTTVSNVSYNGGPSGLKAQATTQEQAALQDKHLPPTAVQSQHHESAGKNRALFASVNNGRPGIAATAKAGEFSGQGVIAARGAAGPQAKLQAGAAGKGVGRTDGMKIANAPYQKHPQRTGRPPQHHDKKPHP